MAISSRPHAYQARILCILRCNVGPWGKWDWQPRSKKVFAKGRTNSVWEGAMLCWNWQANLYPSESHIMPGLGTGDAVPMKRFVLHKRMSVNRRWMADNPSILHDRPIVTIQWRHPRPQPKPNPTQSYVDRVHQMRGEDIQSASRILRREEWRTGEPSQRKISSYLN